MTKFLPIDLSHSPDFSTALAEAAHVAVGFFLSAIDLKIEVNDPFKERNTSDFKAISFRCSLQNLNGF